MIDAEGRPEGWRIELMDERSVHAVWFVDGRRAGSSYAHEAAVTLPFRHTGHDMETTRRGQGRTMTDALRELLARVTGAGYRACLLAPGELSRAELVADAQAEARRVLESMLKERGG